MKQAGLFVAGPGSPKTVKRRVANLCPRLKAKRPRQPAIDLQDGKNPAPAVDASIISSVVTITRIPVTRIKATNVTKDSKVPSNTVRAGFHIINRKHAIQNP